MQLTQSDVKTRTNQAGVDFICCCRLWLAKASQAQPRPANARLWISLELHGAFSTCRDPMGPQVTTQNSRLGPSQANKIGWPWLALLDHGQPTKNWPWRHMAMVGHGWSFLAMAGNGWHGLAEARHGWLRPKRLVPTPKAAWIFRSGQSNWMRGYCSQLTHVGWPNDTFS